MESKFPTCTEHKKACTMYCNNDNKPICDHCLRIHKAHDFLLFEDIWEAEEMAAQSAEIAKGIEEVARLFQQIRGSIEKVSLENEKLLREKAELIREIESNYDKAKIANNETILHLCSLVPKCQKLREEIIRKQKGIQKALPEIKQGHFYIKI